MKNLFLLFSAFLTFNVYSAIPAKPRIAEEKLRLKIAESFPQKARVELSAFFLRGNIPDNATISAVYPLELPMGKVQAEYQWEEKGQQKQALGSAVAKVYLPILVASHDLSQNDPFTPANTRLEEKELSQLRVSGYFLDWNDLSDYRAKGFVAHGTVIGNLQIAKPVLIQPGQIVDLVYRKGNVRISAKVKSLERGIFNQWIRLENPVTKKILQGRVTEFGEASVQ